MADQLPQGGSHLPYADPSDVALVRRTARQARQSQDWEGLRRAGAALRALMPESPDGFLFEAAALRRLQRNQEAHALMRHVRLHFPDVLAAGELKREPFQTTAVPMPTDLKSVRKAVDVAAKTEDWAALETV